MHSVFNLVLKATAWSSIMVEWTISGGWYHWSWISYRQPACLAWYKWPVVHRTGQYWGMMMPSSSESLIYNTTAISWPVFQRMLEQSLEGILCDARPSANNWACQIVTLAVRVNLSREVDGKLLIASHASMWYMSVYICVPHIHNPGVQEDFNDST